MNLCIMSNISASKYYLCKKKKKKNPKQLDAVISSRFMADQ